MKFIMTENNFEEMKNYIKNIERINKEKEFIDKMFGQLIVDKLTTIDIVVSYDKSAEPKTIFLLEEYQKDCINTNNHKYNKISSAIFYIPEKIDNLKFFDFKNKVVETLKQERII